MYINTVMFKQQSAPYTMWFIFCPLYLKKNATAATALWYIKLNTFA